MPKLQFPKKKGQKKITFYLTQWCRYGIIPPSNKGENFMNHALGQVVKTTNTNNPMVKDKYFVITKMDRENEMYEIEDGNQTYSAWDDCLYPVSDTEFFDAHQAGKITHPMIIKAWLKNNGLYRIQPLTMTPI